MPLPKPSEGESRDDFIGRCMHEVAGEFDSQDQRLAVCYRQWGDRGKGMTRTLATRAALYEAAAKGGADDLFVRKALVPDSVEPLANTRIVRFVISTGAVDRDNDTINPKGWELQAYLQNPVVLWAHDYKALPVGRAVAVAASDGKLVSDCEFATHEFAETVYQLVKGGFLKAASVGFKPRKYTINDQRQGLDYAEQELMEWSIVPVPANPEALSLAKAAGVDVEPVLAWARGVLKAQGPEAQPCCGCSDAATMDCGADGCDHKMCAKCATTMKAGRQCPHHDEKAAGLDLDAEADTVRWNRSLSKAFDVDGEPAEPSQQLYKWVSRFLDTPVKDLYETGFVSGGARMGATLSAFDDAVGARFTTSSVRNLHGSSEAPPTYETVRLNSRLSRDFLVEGARFLVPRAAGGTRVVAAASPSWAGVQLRLFAPASQAGAVAALLDEVATRAKAFQFLKGEAFSLSGEFLTRGTESWEDLFLAPAVLDPIRRTAALLNERRAEMESRGLVLMGPPGTGKTLAGRVLMNDTPEATFVWCSARDFYRSGMFGGIESAYAIATENAPSVVFIEDVDSYWSDGAVDLLKTELDGLKQKAGIVTVLTTNHPETLPEALIDRPGRFHDVLNLNLPDVAVRRQMLDKWAPSVSDVVRDELAKRTGGLSGAHLRELVRFAQTIQSQDAVPLADALERALVKVQEQREVIAANRRPVRRAVTPVRPIAATLKGPGGGVPPVDGRCGEGYELGKDGLCHPVEKKPPPAEPEDDDDEDDKPKQACRVCARELAVAMPRLRDDLGVVCAPCFLHATTAPAQATAAAPPADAPPPVLTAELVLDLDDDPREEIAVELDDTPEGVLDLISPADVRAALRSAVTSAVSDLVRDETRAALDRARGRVD
jgi:HK97 family phage prohead protease